MPKIIDDKSQYCIPFVLERLDAHRAKHAGNPNPPPFFLGLNGVQGAGKTVLVSAPCGSLWNIEALQGLIDSIPKASYIS